ncbi:MAG: VCBS repeat-containing protein, partial [Sulfurimonas sp.]|uniref:beta strand repeat-containing protein n=1 Tax=Sulfurimonas sp. TaxID=2022749 RepID=UPI0039E2FA23
MKTIKLIIAAAFFVNTLFAAPSVRNQISGIGGIETTNSTVSVRFSSVGAGRELTNATTTVYGSIIVQKNSAPIITSNGSGVTASINIAENIRAVTTVTSTGTGTRTYSISGGADSAKFSIDTNSGALSFISAPDFETPTDIGGNNIYEVIVTTTDTATLTDSQAISVTVTNSIVEITSDGGTTTATVDSAENQTAVTTVTLDGATGTVTYTLSGTDAGSFAIDSNGVLTFSGNPDYENKSSYSVTVTASDSGTGASIEQTITVNVTNVNEAPTFTNNGGTTVTENSAYSYTATTSDVDGDLLSLTASNLPSWLSIGGDEFTEVGTAGFSAGLALYPSIATDSNNIPYVLYQDGANSYKATVKKFDGSSWVTVGANGFSSGEAKYLSIAIDNTNTPYVAYTDVGNNDKVTVKKFDGSSWVTVGVTGLNAGIYTSLSIDSNNIPYVVYRSHYKATVMKFDGSSWVTVGIAGFSAGDVYFTSMAIDRNNTPYVAYMDGGNNNKATVMKFDGSSWVTVGIAGFSAGTIFQTSIAIDSTNTPYVVYSDGANSYKATVMKFDGSSWVTVGIAGLSAGHASDISITIDSTNTPHIVYMDGVNSNKATVMKFDGSSWVTVGLAGLSAGQVGYTSIAIDSTNTPNIVYVDGANANKATVMKLSATSTLQGTPTVSGVYDVNLTASDGEFTDTQNYQITVADVNDAPVLNDVAFVIGENNATLSSVGNLSASDEDGVNPSLALIGSAEVITYSILSGNTNTDFAINSITGEITIANELNAYTTSTYSLIVKAQDDGGASDTATIIISVSNAADTPIAVADTLTTINEDSSLSFDILSNDTDRDNNINKTSLIITQEPLHGSVQIASANNGWVTYTPNENYNGSDYFTYKVSDTTSLTSNEINATITINAVNDAPVASNSTLNSEEDTNSTVFLTEYVTDVDNGDTITYSIVTSPSHGTLTITDGIVNYTPTLNYYGFDTFTYKANDATVDSNTATIYINMAEVNDIPIAYNDNDNNTTEDNPIIINVLANDSDDNGIDSSTVTISNAPEHGMAVAQGDGTIIYTPTANWYGQDSFEYTVKDNGVATGTQGTGVLISNLAFVSINVSSVNDVPITVADSFTLDEDNVFLMNLHVNDTDVDGDLNGTAITILTQPSNGEVNLTSNGFVRYIPTKDYFGADSFTYKISDGDVNSSSETVSLTINAVNDAPSFISPIDYSVTENSTSTIVALSAQDVENNTPFTYTLNTTQDSSFFTLTGSNLSFTKPRNYESEVDANGDNIYNVNINVSDNLGASTLRTFNVSVTDINDAPVADDQTNTGAEIAVLNASVVSIDEDSGDTKTFSTTAVVDGFTFNADGSYIFDATHAAYNSLNVGQTQIIDILITVTDNAGLTDTLTLKITVTGTNDTPIAVADTGTTSENVDLSFTNATLTSNDTDADTGATLRVVAVAVATPVGQGS